MTEKPTGLELLRAPFPSHQISKLPKPYKKDSPKGTCQECGGYHALPAMHLDYVGHAALTDRLLDTDPSWTWEPLALTADGLPVLDRDGGLWIRLTVCGVTRLGYGDAQDKVGPSAMKERIGDALRNAAMRFGAALDLWHKGDLHRDEEDHADEHPSRGAQERQRLAQRAGTGQEDNDALREPHARREVLNENPTVSDDEAKAAATKYWQNEIAEKNPKATATMIWGAALGLPWTKRLTIFQDGQKALAHILKTLGQVGEDIIADTMSEYHSKENPEVEDYVRAFEKLMAAASLKKGAA